MKRSPMLAAFLCDFITEVPPAFGYTKTIKENKED